MKEKIFREGEKIFFPIDEKIDEQCYELNNINNWAECFYNLKSGIILERYKELISRTENSKFFEALNYEYGINNYPLDTNRAFQIYKTAADTSTDTLSMYRLYRIYKKDFKKFNIRKRNLVLEKFYILKCYAYLTPREKDSYLYSRFDIYKELSCQLKNSNDKKDEWFKKLIRFLYKNYKLYNINRDDVMLIEEIINKKFYFQRFGWKIEKLADNGHPEAMYNLSVLGEFKGKKYFKELYQINYYRSFSDFPYSFDSEIQTLDIVKKSILNGYYSHIKYYIQIFTKINDLEDIFKLDQLKSELMFIFGCMIDAIIADEIEIFINYIYMRKISIKYYKFENEFKTHFDLYTKEIINYLMKFTKGTYEENRKIMKIYYLNTYFNIELYKIFSLIYYYGVSGIIEKNLKESLNYMEKNPRKLSNDKYRYLYYKIRIKERKMTKNIKKANDSNKDNINNDEDLIKFEKDILKKYYDDFIAENIKKLPPSFFYILSRFYSSSSIDNEDIIFEYVLLNRAVNAALPNKNNFDFDNFEQKYFQFKAKKKLAEKNNEIDFKDLTKAKGIIKVEGYGDDGIICPICFENQKSTICLPCKHFFCSICIKKLIKKGNCPICRREIKITFDINLQKESLMQSILSNSYIYD